MYFKGNYVYKVYLTHSKSNSHGTTLGAVPEIDAKFRLANDCSATVSQNSGFKRPDCSYRIDLSTKKGVKF